MVELVIIRGIPGSGKSTYAKGQYPLHILVEADQYFMKDGIYTYDKTRIHKAHKQCFEKVSESLRQGLDTVVANTFIKRRDITKYLELMSKVHVDVTIVELLTSYGSIHNVPEATMDKMRIEWESIPVYWKVKLIKVYSKVHVLFDEVQPTNME